MGIRDSYSCIRGRVVELTLPQELEEISSTRIRDAVDANRDVSNLIDTMAQEFIYRHGLYLREPQDKPCLLYTSCARQSRNNKKSHRGAVGFFYYPQKTDEIFFAACGPRTL